MKKNQVKFTCAKCGNSFYSKPSRINNSKSGLLFCSRKCKDEAQRIGGIKEIQPPHYKDGLFNYRQNAFREYDHKCNRCGYDKVVEILQVHHIDENRENNQIENLEILCPNCHEENHHYNKSGRFWKTNLGI
jgi:predicted RNA-binding Zn-ribbon protein involved in translation (DUF1610 family)